MPTYVLRGVDHEMIKKAKAVARLHKTSLDKMLYDYIQTIASVPSIHIELKPDAQATR